MLKVDIHTHIIPKKIPDFSRKFGYEGFVSMANETPTQADMVIFGEKFRTIKCNCWSVKDRLTDMKEHQLLVYIYPTARRAIPTWAPVPLVFIYIYIYIFLILFLFPYGALWIPVSSGMTSSELYQVGWNEVGWHGVGQSVSRIIG